MPDKQAAEQQPAVGKIYPAMCRILKEMDAVGKDLTNDVQKYPYRSIDHMVDEVHRLCAENEVFLVPEILESWVDIREVVVKGDTKKQFIDMVKVAFHWTAIDGSQVTMVTQGSGFDSLDKGSPKAHTNALKVALGQGFLMPFLREFDTDEPNGDAPAVNDDENRRENLKKIIKELGRSEASFIDWLANDKKYAIPGEVKEVDRLSSSQVKTALAEAMKIYSEIKRKKAEKEAAKHEDEK